MRKVGWVAIAGAGLAALSTARAGHEPPVYPSYYPQEIRIEPIDPAAAGRALAEGRIQAYVGQLAGVPAGAEQSVKFVESLGSFLVVHVNPDTPRAADADGRCALAAQAVSALAGEQDGFRLHPYPINPFHADYFDHFDLAARQQGVAGKYVAVAAVVTGAAGHHDPLRLRPMRQGFAPGRLPRAAHELEGIAQRGRGARLDIPQGGCIQQVGGRRHPRILYLLR